jgi:ABC-type Fe3+ transport system permease subunit
MIEIYFKGERLLRGVIQDVELPTIEPQKSTALVFLGMFAYFGYLYHLGVSEVTASLEQVDLAV